VLGYARNRYIGMDFERTARQRRVLELIFNKVKDLNLTEINDLLNRVLPQITTNLTEGELFSLILGLPAYSKYSLEEWSIPVKGTYSFVIIRRMDVIGIDFKENIKELQKRIYGEK
jgi:anionic cell wall polymer biosynthesis LytR-Cps2A-Psr (LCP) family protein